MEASTYQVIALIFLFIHEVSKMLRKNDPEAHKHMLLYIPNKNSRVLRGYEFLRGIFFFGGIFCVEGESSHFVLAGPFSCRISTRKLQ